MPGGNGIPFLDLDLHDEKKTLDSEAEDRRGRDKPESGMINNHMSAPSPHRLHLPPPTAGTREGTLETSLFNNGVQGFSLVASHPPTYVFLNPWRDPPDLILILPGHP